LTGGLVTAAVAAGDDDVIQMNQMTRRRRKRQVRLFWLSSMMQTWIIRMILLTLKYLMKASLFPLPL